MCGIAGLLSPVRGEAFNARMDTVRNMAAALVHRGPDDRGAWHDADNGVALGHTRLAIVDLSMQGRQPRQSRDGRYVLAYNGEIYNYLELRRELSKGGAAFDGHSDTEVLVEAIARWGMVPALERVHGMFAFALWDRVERTLSLACDRLGEKPLYYGHAGKDLVFASELKAVVKHPQFVPGVDHCALAHFFHLNYIPAPHCIYPGFRKLEPGHWITFKAAADEVRSAAAGRYWTLPRPGHDPGRARARLPESRVVDDLHAVLLGAVGQRLHSDVPLGAFLSGGIDSSLVTALMQAAGAGKVRTFTVGFNDAALDESRHAGRIAAHLGTEHTELRVSAAEALDLVPRLPEIYDEPFADSSQIPVHLMCRATAGCVRVALSGDGGDEMFAGYFRYIYARSVADGLMRLPGPLRRGLAAMLRAVPPDRVTSPGNRLGLPAAGQKFERLAAMLAGPWEMLYWNLVDQWGDLQRLMPGAPPDCPDPSCYRLAADVPAMEAMQYLDAAGYLPGDILTKVDRASMAVGLEVRVPLLDHTVVEHAASLPRRYKVRGRAGKWILRRILQRYVPEALFHRPKQGFAAPVAGWLRGPLRDWGEVLLCADRLKSYGLLNPDTMQRLWSEHQSRKRDWSARLWAILMFQAWHEHWIG